MAVFSITTRFRAIDAGHLPTTPVLLLTNSGGVAVPWRCQNLYSIATAPRPTAHPPLFVHHPLPHDMPTFARTVRSAGDHIRGVYSALFVGGRGLTMGGRKGRRRCITGATTPPPRTPHLHRCLPLRAPPTPPPVLPAFSVVPCCLIVWWDVHGY